MDFQGEENPSINSWGKHETQEGYDHLSPRQNILIFCFRKTFPFFSQVIFTPAFSFFSQTH